MENSYQTFDTRTKAKLFDLTLTVAFVIEWITTLDQSPNTIKDRLDNTMTKFVE